MRSEAADALAVLGLQPEEPARFRRRADQHWRPAVVVAVEADGSLRLRDRKGAAVAIPTELVEVATTGPRGGRVWETVAQRAARAEQLKLL